MKLLVIGDKTTINMFRILGSDGIDINNTGKEEIRDFIKMNKDIIGAVLVKGSEEKEKTEYVIQKLNKYDLAWIMLPSQSNDVQSEHGFAELNKLAEQAIGLKLNNIE